MTQTLGLSAPPINLHMTPSRVVQLTHLRDGMSSINTQPSLRSGTMGTSWDLTSVHVLQPQRFSRPDWTKLWVPWVICSYIITNTVLSRRLNSDLVSPILDGCNLWTYKCIFPLPLVVLFWPYITAYKYNTDYKQRRMFAWTISGSVVSSSQLGPQRNNFQQLISWTTRLNCQNHTATQEEYVRWDWPPWKRLRNAVSNFPWHTIIPQRTAQYICKVSVSWAMKKI